MEVILYCYILSIKNYIFLYQIIFPYTKDFLHSIKVKSSQNDYCSHTVALQLLFKVVFFQNIPQNGSFCKSLIKKLLCKRA